jgi:hypothetical protein
MLSLVGYVLEPFSPRSQVVLGNETGRQVELGAAKGFPRLSLGTRKKGMTGLSFGRNIIDQLERWANELASPLMPPREVFEEGAVIQLEFREHIPHTVMRPCVASNSMRDRST